MTINATISGLRFFFEITLEQGNRAAARAHGIVLAEAYEAVGRDDRIRGLEGLLGEPLRPVAELPAVVVEAPAEALSGAGEDEGGPDLRPSPAGEAAEPELVSRATQAGLGLLTGLVVAMLAKLWLLDRMAWVHRETLGTEPPPPATQRQTMPSFCQARRMKKP